MIQRIGICGNHIPFPCIVTGFGVHRSPEILRRNPGIHLFQRNRFQPHFPAKGRVPHIGPQRGPMMVRPIVQFPFPRITLLPGSLPGEQILTAVNPFNSRNFINLFRRLHLVSARGIIRQFILVHINRRRHQHQPDFQFLPFQFPGKCF